MIDRINQENDLKYGPICTGCDYYSHACRCSVNDVYKNKDVAESLQKVITRLRNEGYFKNQTMDSPIEVLSRDLLTIVHTIELSGNTMEEVLSHINNNFKKYG